MKIISRETEEKVDRLRGSAGCWGGRLRGEVERENGCL